MAASTPEELPRAIEAAVNAGDVQTAAELWDEGAVIVGADGRVVGGGEAVRHALRALVENDAQLEIRLLGLVVAGDIALANGVLTIRTLAAGGEPTEQRSSSVVVYRRGPTGWRVAVDAPWGLPEGSWPRS